MADDFKAIADEAINECARYLALLQLMRLQLNKQASYSLDELELLKSVASMQKCGSLTAEEAPKALEILRNDPNAALRTIQALCEQANADSLVKNASEQLSYGKLISNKIADTQPVVDKDTAWTAVAKALGINL